MKCQQWLAIAVLLTGCSASPYSKTSHEVQVSHQTNAFLQTEEIASWSIRSYSDRHGNRWPVGLTLSARATRHIDGDSQRFLIVRHDQTSTATDATIYDEARLVQAQLQQQCKTISLSLDGRQLSLPAYSLTVRTLTNTRRMPVMPTDYSPNPIEIMVGKNTSDQFVLSTLILLQVDPETWRSFASADTLLYEACGKSAQASSAELKGLREVIESAEPISR